MKTNTEAIQFLNALTTNIDSGILSFDMEGYVTLVNTKALDYLNIEDTVNSIIDTSVLDHIKIPEIAKLIKNCLTKARKPFHKSDIQYQDRYLIIDGRKLLGGMLLSITDVTDNVIAKDKATQSLLLGQETERRRLAKEIHDGVGPNMSSLKLQLDAVKRKLKDKEGIKAIERITDSISEIAHDIRQISHDLMPSSLIDFGVVTALSNFANKITDAGEIEIEYQSNIEDKILSHEYELNIYRIVQELVNNAIKHSKCSSIQINLMQEKELIKVFVQDDGQGMDVSVSPSGIGLNNISTRVESLQGNLDIESQLGGGVTIHIELPLKS